MPPPAAVTSSMAWPAGGRGGRRPNQGGDTGSVLLTGRRTPVIFQHTCVCVHVCVCGSMRFIPRVDLWPVPTKTEPLCPSWSDSLRPCPPALRKPQICSLPLWLCRASSAARGRSGLCHARAAVPAPPAALASVCPGCCLSWGLSSFLRSSNIPSTALPVCSTIQSSKDVWLPESCCCARSRREYWCTLFCMNICFPFSGMSAQRRICWVMWQPRVSS